ncbi:LOW QUALITY PROTEIN: uncharacterized protein LOC119191991 [Manduca sexta]|uniref:LOW QUALITY PROTEIN: uncharacterized protein LOC119191991 n=1 Tax=Manduca sexta TaxID=7130 RepID=UPI0018909FE1|nr:LOW QUALITY PROTEIN: uncharacterized protein LOC119191991 [Manduca sexta]
MNKIDAICCLDSGCIERLSTLDATTSELRLRAGKLAKREAERAELLERAEAAWKNLELGYHRRLTLAEEKEDDISKQSQKLIEERNSYKTVCTTLVQQLKERGEAAEKDQVKLSEVEKTVYDRACVRLRLSEQVAKGESALAEQHCRGAQADRDLQFKEEEARRKLHNMESELESTRALTHDAERALRAELGALKEQVARVSQLLLAEDADTGQIKKELEELQLEKMGMVEDLDGCKVMCENRMQGKMNELKAKKQQLNELNDKVIECRCKFPIDATVEVKRTASLAALCHCTPEDKNLDSCSCTSLRSQLLSNLLADLFGGLLTELGWTGSQMPCQLLKCLEDSHNWDRSSVLKTNLRSFFARLLVGELDIAIATSIEKYHAKWVGATCADITRTIPNIRESDSIAWQDCAMERRAQKLATKLAEQLFKDRADELAQRAKDIVTSGPPPCECGPQSAAYSCIVKQPTITAGNTKGGETISPYWRRTQNDVTQLRLQVESLKKDAIKKVDLKTMEENIAKLVERTSVQDSVIALTADRTEEATMSTKPLNLTCSSTKRKSSLINGPKKGNKKICNMTYQTDKSAKSFNKLKQTFAVNLCLCGTQTAAKKIAQDDKRLPERSTVQNYDKNSLQKIPSNIPSSQIRKEQNLLNVPLTQIPRQQNSANAPVSPISRQTRPSNGSLSQIPSIIKKTKPINTLKEISNDKQSNTSTKIICKKECVCFHNKPSNTSIDKLLETIAKWKSDLTVSSTNQGKKYKMDQYVMPSEKSIKVKKSSRVSYEFDEEAEKQVIKSIEKRHSSDNQGYIKDTEVQQVVPRTTESEYIGAVNLDKSNESLCKCDDKDDKKKDCDTGTPHKCITSKKCCCKKSSTKSDIPSEKPLPIDEKPMGNDDRKLLQNNSSTKMGIKTKDLFSCDCDITLLGVTLADKKSNKRQKIHTNYSGCNDDDDYDTDNDFNRMNKFNYNKMKRKGRKGRKARRNHCDDCSISCNIPPTCQCQDNVEIKDFITDFCNKPKDVFILSVDKGIDVNDTFEGESKDDNIMKGELKVEDCICCNLTDVVETKNLEENTFHLLEEHLKEKLNDFKRTSCKSSCIPLEDEKKLFSTLIYRVKQIILDTTNNVSCRCSSKPPMEGSWNRAYSLLQEYLKAKIQRLQCQCTTKEHPPPIENILDRVSKLIEHDFERLKNICKCNIMDQTHGINVSGQILWEEETPVKDLCKPQANGYLVNDETQHSYGSEGGTIGKPEQDSLKSIIFTENMSSQVPLNLGMETKSCNVFEKTSVNIQTSEIKKISAYNESEAIVTKSHHDCCCDIPQKQYVPAFGFGTTEVLVNQFTKVAKGLDVNRFPNIIHYRSYSYPGLDPQRCTATATENNKNAKTNNGTNTCNDDNCNASKITNFPYVGYTVDCSCDRNIGSCVCMKSVVQANNDKIVDMWKTYIDYNKTQLKNVSYIMKSTGLKPITIIDRVTEESHRETIESTEYKKHEFCEVKLSTSGDEDITLKKSRRNIDVHSAACALTESFNVDSNCLEGKDSLDWCECSSRPVNVSNTAYGNTVCSPSSSDMFERDLGDDVALAQLPRNCNCDVVPICHVKMLVESIENKLIQSHCTCDSLVSVVCPIHSSGLL